MAESQLAFNEIKRICIFLVSKKTDWKEARKLGELHARPSSIGKPDFINDPSELNRPSKHISDMAASDVFEGTVVKKMLLKLEIG